MPVVTQTKKNPTAVPKAFENAAKKRELAGRLRLAAKKSVAQNIKKSNIGIKNRQKLLDELKKKKTGPMSVKTSLKKKESSGGMRAIRSRKQLNQKFAFGDKSKPSRGGGASWRFN